MKTIKFLSPTHILLDGEMLTKCKYSKIYDNESGTFIELTDNLGYGYQYDFSQFYDTQAVGSSLSGDGIILPSLEPSVFELKKWEDNIKGTVR